MINFNKPFYSATPILKTLYESVFKKLVFCGDRKYDEVLQIEENNGFQGYACLIKAMEMHPTGYTGYFYTNDDVLLNFWNLNFDPDIIWISQNISKRNFHRLGQQHLKTEWHWWSDRQEAAKRCQKAYKKIEHLAATTQKACNQSKAIHSLYTQTEIHHQCKNSWKDNLETFQANTGFPKTKIICLAGRSDAFYIPSKFKEVFRSIASVYIEEKVFLETAVPSILNYLARKEEFLNLQGMYYNDIYGYSKEYYNGQAFLKTYTSNVTFSHPFKLWKNTPNKVFLENYFLPEMNHRASVC